MYEYKFTALRVLDGSSILGSIDLGFNVHLQRRVKLAGISCPAPRLDYSIADPKERAEVREKGLKARSRARELVKEGGRQPEGLILQSFHDKDLASGYACGDVKFIYARDLFNYNPHSRPWIGWKSLGAALVQEGLATYV